MTRMQANTRYFNVNGTPTPEGLAYFGALERKLMLITTFDEATTATLADHESRIEALEP